jgi:hypothetical protein
MKNKTEEKDFQDVATDHGKDAVAWMREELDALEHANSDCSGDVECEDCSGSGTDAEDDECKTCGGTGEVKCTAGHDSDDPEAWHDPERARQRIEEGPLSVEVRSGWHTPGDEDVKAEEFCILLGTGGPAARIIGELDDYGQPTRARYQYQDWFKPWTEAILDSDGYATLLEYSQNFYFGE